MAAGTILSRRTVDHHAVRCHGNRAKHLRHSLAFRDFYVTVAYGIDAFRDPAALLYGNIMVCKAFPARKTAWLSLHFLFSAQINDGAYFPLCQQTNIVLRGIILHIAAQYPPWPQLFPVQHAVVHTEIPYIQRSFQE